MSRNSITAALAALAACWLAMTAIQPARADNIQSDPVQKMTFPLDKPEAGSGQSFIFRFLPFNLRGQQQSSSVQNMVLTISAVPSPTGGQTVVALAAYQIYNQTHDANGANGGATYYFQLLDAGGNQVGPNILTGQFSRRDCTYKGVWISKSTPAVNIGQIDLGKVVRAQIATARPINERPC